MLDQSFSSNNFYSILTYENRKGMNLEKQYFEDDIFKKYTLEVKRYNEAINKRRKETIEKEVFYRYKRFINYLKKNTKKEKEKKLLELLQKVSDNILKTDFKLNITTGTSRGKTIYKIDDTPENYFTLKQLQYNFRKLYKVKQSNRFEIVNQVKNLLNDRFPKYIIKTDLKSFYENIPIDTLLQKIHEDNLLSPLSKKFLRQIIKRYKELSGATKGIPRGIGVSAYLSELYLRDLDTSIRNLSYISYYQRYVDDMILIFTPETSNVIPSDFLSKVESLVVGKGLELNKTGDKTQEINLLQEVTGGTIKTYNLEYLGYKYTFEIRSKRKNISEIIVSFSDNKKSRYKTKIDFAFTAYSKLRIRDKNRAYRILKSRVKFLTCNTRLSNNKKRILIGIFFSNSLLNNENDLTEIDDYLAAKILAEVPDAKQQTILTKYTFIEGFKQKKFVPFTAYQLQSIMKIWNTL